MSLSDDINALPTNVVGGTEDHLSHHKTIHEALKDISEKQIDMDDRINPLETIHGVSRRAIAKSYSVSNKMSEVTESLSKKTSQEDLQQVVDQLLHEMRSMEARLNTRINTKMDR